MIDQKMSRTETRKQAGIRTSILAKMGKDERESMDNLAKICIALGRTLDNVVEISADTAAGKRQVAQNENLHKARACLKNVNMPNRRVFCPLDGAIFP